MSIDQIRNKGLYFKRCRRRPSHDDFLDSLFKPLHVH